MARLTKTPLTEKTLANALKSYEKGADVSAVLYDSTPYLQIVFHRRTDGTCSGTWFYRRQKSKACPKAREISIGRYRSGASMPVEVSLQAARKKAEEFSSMIANGLDPVEERKKQAEAEAARAAIERIKALTFEAAARAYIEEYSEAWAAKNPYRERKARGNLNNHIAPVIGAVPVSELTWRDVLRVMMSGEYPSGGCLYTEQPDTAKKCRELIRKTCAHAQCLGVRPDDVADPCDMDGPLGQTLAKYQHKIKASNNHPSLKPEQAPAFFADLCALPPSRARDSLILGMLTGLRVGSLVAIRWSAINEEEPSIRIPESDRKTKDGDYLSFLSSYALAFLRTLPRVGDYVFFGKAGRSHVTNQTPRLAVTYVNDARTRAGLPEWVDPNFLDAQGCPRAVVPHGVCRTALKTWCSEDVHNNDERFKTAAVELVLDHNEARAKGDRYNGAYDRSRLKARRLEVVEAWGRFLVTGRYPDEADGAPCEGWARILSGTD